MRLEFIIAANTALIHTQTRLLAFIIYLSSLFYFQFQKNKIKKIFFFFFFLYNYHHRHLNNKLTLRKKEQDFCFRFHEMKANTAARNQAYSKCSFYKPYLSFLDTKRPAAMRKTTTPARKNVVQFYVENETSTGKYFHFIKSLQLINQK